ncbi:MAG: hypothetical protein ACYDCF_04580 [Burkholderiales bacterium]
MTTQTRTLPEKVAEIIRMHNGPRPTLHERLIALEGVEQSLRHARDDHQDAWCDGGWRAHDEQGKEVKEALFVSYGEGKSDGKEIRDYMRRPFLQVIHPCVSRAIHDIRANATSDPENPVTHMTTHDLQFVAERGDEYGAMAAKDCFARTVRMMPVEKGKTKDRGGDSGL